VRCKPVIKNHTAGLWSFLRAAGHRKPISGWDGSCRPWATQRHEAILHRPQRPPIGEHEGDLVWLRQGGRPARRLLPRTRKLSGCRTKPISRRHRLCASKPPKGGLALSAGSGCGRDHAVAFKIRALGDAAASGPARLHDAAGLRRPLQGCPFVRHLQPQVAAPRRRSARSCGDKDIDSGAVSALIQSRVEGKQSRRLVIDRNARPEALFLHRPFAVARSEDGPILPPMR
jgi:hypothetical protein